MYSNSNHSSTACSTFTLFSNTQHIFGAVSRQFVKQIQVHRTLHSSLLVYFSSQTFRPSLNSHSQPVLPSSCWGCFCQHFLVHKWAGSRRVIHPPPWLQIINKAPASNLCLTVYLDYQWWHRRLLSTRPTRANQIVWYLVCCLAWPGPL